MTTIITFTDLESHPGIAGTREHTASVAQRASALVYQKWANPVTPVPAWVKEIAIDVALRVLINPKGLESVTKSADDVSITERHSVSGGRLGMHLTDREAALLSGAARSARFGSMRIGVPGYTSAH